MTEFFLRNIVLIYFFYGLSFFSMGLAIMIELGHNSELDFAKALVPLAWFGIVHGGNEWFEMYLLMNPAFAGHPHNSWISPFRVFLLAASFMLLIAFGARLISGPARPALQWGMMFAVGAIWGIGLFELIVTPLPRGDRLVAADVYSRYALGIPGAALVVWGLILQRARFKEQGMKNYADALLVAAIAFGIYGGIGQLFTASSSVFPSNLINSSKLLQWFGFPVQLLRAAMATFAAAFIIHSLRVFDFENRRRIEALRQAQIEERRRLEETRAELLHRTVKAQEAERQRIARELHDETGQTLTALGLGLRGLTSSIHTNPERAEEQAKHLEKLAGNGLNELQRLVAGLHPPQLDDLGLLAALRWYINEIRGHYAINIKLTTQGDTQRLPIETRIVLFRIAQEALTNIVRHADTDQAEIHLECDSAQVRLHIRDYGKGFDVSSALSAQNRDPCWGLMGMQERANLIGADLEIQSIPDEGTQILVVVPIKEGIDV